MVFSEEILHMYIKFIPKYFMFWGNILSEFFFKISFPNYLLVVYKNTIYFCIFTLYPLTLPITNGYFIDSLGFSSI